MFYNHFNLDFFEKVYKSFKLLAFLCLGNGSTWLEYKVYFYEDLLKKKIFRAFFLLELFNVSTKVHFHLIELKIIGICKV